MIGSGKISRLECGATASVDAAGRAASPESTDVEHGNCYNAPIPVAQVVGTPKAEHCTPEMRRVDGVAQDTNRKRTSARRQAEETVQARQDPYLAARTFLERQGELAGQCSLSAFAREIGIARQTIAHHLEKIGEEEREQIRETGRANMQKQGGRMTASEKRAATWASKAAVGKASGQAAQYKQTGVTFAEYQIAFQWGVREIVSKRLTPCQASAAVCEKFHASISKDAMRMAARKCGQASEVQPPRKAGPECILPAEIEEGMVKIVELLRAHRPSFPVFKQDILQRVQTILRTVPEFNHIWCNRDNLPTDRWYNGWLRRWEDRILASQGDGTAAECPEIDVVSPLAQP